MRYYLFALVWAPVTARTGELKRTSLMGMREWEREKLFYSQWRNEYNSALAAIKIEKCKDARWRLANLTTEIRRHTQGTWKTVVFANRNKGRFWSVIWNSCQKIGQTFLPLSKHWTGVFVLVNTELVSCKEKKNINDRGNF